MIKKSRFYIILYGNFDYRNTSPYLINLLCQMPCFYRRNFAHLTGGAYCISATTLQSVYAKEIGPWCADYERRYRSAVAEMGRSRKTATSDSSARLAQIANDDAISWPKKIKEFERLRLERLCAYLRHRTPVGQIGYSIFVFDLNENEINRALYGPPAELSPGIRVSGL